MAKRIRFTAGVFLALIGARALADLTVLLGDANELLRRVDAATATARGPAQKFGDRLTSTERLDLQGSCTALVADASDVRAQRRLQEYLARYQGDDLLAVLRFCLDPAYTRLHGAVKATTDAIRQAGESASEPLGLDLQGKLQQETRMYEALRNVMKTKHEAAKNTPGSNR